MMKRNSLKKILFTVVLLCVAYFIIGYLAVLFKLFDLATYQNYALIAGGLASAIGLLSLIRPAISIEDLNNLELTSLKKLTASISEMQDMENKRAQTEEEIDKLALNVKKWKY